MRVSTRLLPSLLLGVLTVVLVAVPGRGESLTISGKAVFKGEAKKFEPKPIAAVEGTECQLGPALKTEDVIINETTPPTLRNVVVSIKSGPIDFRTPRPKPETTLVAKNCRFDPHIVALQQGQKLVVRNEDPFMQRVQLNCTKNKSRGFSMPKPGMQMQMSFEEEEPFKIISPSYEWMTAWCVVFKHPYFVVTGADGAFEFSDFPPGKYEVVAWHEKFGTQTATIDIQPGQPNTVEFVFEPKEGESAGG